MKKLTIAASILAADLLNLQDDLRHIIAAGIDTIHFDVMDFHFVNNLTFGPELCQQIQQEFPKVFLDVHLMTYNVARLSDAFIKAGAKCISFHLPAVEPSHAQDIISNIKANNCQVGLVLNPDEAVDTIAPLLASIDKVTIMTVVPGFGGQKLIPQALQKIAAVKQLNNKVLVSVDGGVNLNTIDLIFATTTDIAVVGSGIFNYPKEQYQAVIKQLQQAKEH